MIHVSPALRRIATTFALAIAAAGAYALLAPAPAGAAMPRVLAIRFGPDLEVNAVTKDYVNHQLDEAEKHYDAAVIELETPGGLSSSLRSILSSRLQIRLQVYSYSAFIGDRWPSSVCEIAEPDSRIRGARRGCGRLDKLVVTGATPC